MKHSSKSVGILAWLVAAGSFGCAAAPFDDASSAGQAVTANGRGAGTGQPAASARPALVAGEYKLVNDSIKGTLVIDAVEPTSLAFHLTAVRRNQGGGFGDVSTRASIVDGVATLQQGDDCTLTLRPAGTAVTMSQEGTCQDLGFGAYVDASGLYELQAREAVGFAAGKYRLETTHAGATLEISRPSPTAFTFDLSVVMKPSTNFGDIAFGSAKVEGSNATYEPADDCKLTFESKDGTVLVEQYGTCESQGFGNAVTASGRYGK